VESFPSALENGRHCFLMASLSILSLGYCPDPLETRMGVSMILLHNKIFHQVSPSDSLHLVCQKNTVVSDSKACSLHKETLIVPTHQLRVSSICAKLKGNNHNPVDFDVESKALSNGIQS
jgi:hypothetical protein